MQFFLPFDILFRSTSNKSTRQHW